MFYDDDDDFYDDEISATKILTSRLLNLQSEIRSLPNSMNKKVL